MRARSIRLVRTIAPARLAAYRRAGWHVFARLRCGAVTVTLDLAAPGDGKARAFWRALLAAGDDPRLSDFPRTTEAKAPVFETAGAAAGGRRLPSRLAPGGRPSVPPPPRPEEPQLQQREADVTRYRYDFEEGSYRVRDIGRGIVLATTTEREAAAGLVHLLNLHGLPPLGVAEGFAQRRESVTRAARAAS